MKKRVLIVEDDKFFRMAVKRYIKWEKYGFEITGEAVHGKAALEFLDAQPVEVVVTDMSMPIMNGVELIREMKEKYPDIMCIALSAYDDFEFVKDSLKAGAGDYILKQDIEKEDTGHTIAKAWKKHLESMALESTMKEGIQTYFRGGRSALEKRAEKYLQLCMEDGYGFYLCVVKNLNTGWATADCEKNIWLRESVLELHDKGGHCFLLPVRQDVSFMKQYQTRDELLEKIFVLLAGENYLAACSKLALKAEQIPKCFQQTQQAMEIAGFLGRRKIILWEKVCDTVRKTDFLEEKECYEEIFCLLDAERSLDELTKKLRNTMPDAEHIRKNYLQWLTVIAENLQIKVSNQKYADIKESLEHTVFLEQKQEIMSQYLKELFAETENTSFHSAVASCMRFMNKNLAKELSLAEIAEYVGMNESYLSNLFKKETGQSITEYLNSIRIKKAKELIRQTNDKNYEIGEKVGFINASYFSTIFKKETGMTIQEYRRQNQKNLKEIKKI